MDPLDGQDVYAAEKILKSRTRKGKTEYLIKWKGWSNQHNTWEPSSNILNENLFTESGFPVPSDFKGGSRKGSRRSNRGRKRKAKEISDSDDSDGDNQSYDEGASDSRSEGSEASVRSSSNSRLGTPVAALTEEPNTENSKSSKMLRKRGPKSKKNDIPAASASVSKNSEANDDKLETKELKGEKSNKEQGVEESPKTEANVELDKDEKAKIKSIPSETKLDLSNTDKVGNDDSALSETEIFRIIEDSEGEPIEKKNVTRDDEVKKIRKPEVFEGRSGSVQVVSNGQEQIISRLAFVVDGTSDLSRSSEQLQLHDYGESDESRIRVIADQLKNETKVWTDVNNTRFESFQYNGSHTITEITVNQHTVPIIEL
ncbi:unnamed protein product [Litomosoides sigmodontis]|uniref:Chromo domain-containing protein n=1 Tax=Litomosoides sigmodontis TaxID=42156 RepID=A0A3P6UL10_LITSI|nr:unnamed protein product [Litomosoides sigmodontis]